MNGLIDKQKSETAKNNFLKKFQEGYILGYISLLAYHTYIFTCIHIHIYPTNSSVGARYVS